MATNRTYDLDSVASLPVAEGTVSGDPVLIGALVGVALTDRGDGGNAATYATVALRGVFALEVEADDGAIAAGTAVYITSGGALVGDASGNTLFGHAYEAIGNGETATINVRLAG